MNSKAYLTEYDVEQVLGDGFTAVIVHEGFFFVLVQQPPIGHGLLIHEVSRSHTTTHHIR